MRAIDCLPMSRMTSGRPKRRAREKMMDEPMTMPIMGYRVPNQGPYK